MSEFPERDPRPDLRGEDVMNVVMPKRWRHVKRGSEYTLLTLATMQCSSNPNLDYAIVVIYVSDDGIMWVRPRAEFFDGRFEAIRE